MITNRRERLLLIATGLALGGFILDRVWLGPLLDRKAQVDKAHATARQKLSTMERIARREPRERRLLDRVERELRQRSTSTAVLDLNKRLRKLATDSGADSNKVDFERRQKVDAYEEVVYRLDLQTSIKALQKLLYLLDTLALPIKISNLSINRQQKGEDLRVIMRVSMLTLNGKSGAAE